jgi:hypothetical protein
MEMTDTRLERLTEHNRAVAVFAAAFLATLAFVFMAVPAEAIPEDPCPDCGGGGNSAPTVAVNNGSVTFPEGQTASNAGTYSDADGNATVTLSASVGTVTRDAAGTWSWSFGTNDGPDQSQTVTITADDGAGGTATTTFSLTVNNVAPTVNLQNGFPSVPEGGAFSKGYTSYGYNLSVSDPGNDTWTLNTGCGTNGSEWQESSNTVWCGFFDGPGSSVVSASATDSDGATRTSSVNVNVSNRNPDAVLNAPASINEGGTATISLTKGGFQTQDGETDTNAGLHYAFDCNGGSLSTATYANSGTTSSTTCPYDDNGTKTVRARIIDKDGGFNEYTRNITVNNVAPTATFDAPTSVNQGANFNLSLSGIVEPSSADGASLTYAFDCGDGSGYVPAGNANKSCTAVDQPTVTVKGKVTDKDGGSNEYTANVTVNNVAPTGTITINGGAAATKSATVSLALSAADPLPGSGVGSMRFHNEDTETWSAWEPFATSRAWLLSSGEGNKTVYVQYRDNADNISTTVIRDAIKLDTTAPTISGMSPAPGSTIRDRTPAIKATVGDNLTNLQKANIKLYVNGVRISATKWSYSASTDLLTYNSPALSAGKKTVKIVATDGAKNVGTRSWSFTIR